MVTRVLCVDENATSRRLLSLMLERLGHRATVVGGEREALAELKKQRFDLITIDMGVPMDYDGIEAYRQIKSTLLAQNQSTPIVAITACAMFGDREQCLRLGMDDYLSKPFTSRALKTLLERWLETDRQPHRRAG